ncbi:monocarboxylate transporter 9-like isoform X2 [Lineus longissimus]|uniref:monocarboxylate transporter 9-like isoform X2 n=1 Tax=Lineus longissimus TaxID=88925 RepID=UPI002B4F2FF8
MAVQPHFGWVALAASFWTLFISQGVYYSSGLFFVEWMDQFGKGGGLTSWVGSLNIGLCCLGGPIAGMATNKWGYQKVVFLSGLIISGGLIGAAYSPGIYTLMVSYGVIAGVGYGLMYSPAATIAVWYFEENCGLALGIATCGGGCGTFLMPLVIEALMEAYGWRGCMLILGGLSLNISVCGALMRTLPNMPHKNPQKRTSIAQWDVFKNPAFIVHLVHHLLFSVAMSVTYVHLVAVVEKATGVHGLESSMVMVMFGLANFIGRFAQGAFANTGKMDVVTQYSISYLIFGATVIVVPHVTIYGLLLFISFILGLTSAPWGVLLQLVVTEIVGKDRMVAAYGYSWFASGIGFVFGAPIAGWLLDATKSYDTSLYFGGSCVILSILIMGKFWYDRCRRPPKAESEVIPEVTPASNLTLNKLGMIYASIDGLAASHASVNRLAASHALVNGIARSHGSIRTCDAESTISDLDANTTRTESASFLMKACVVDDQTPS